ncbi:hypothetical protein [Stappia sp.]|uniref:hypothetical protein n=1 Tax=Stappia sp. TaxID=1870903 RepID=UPI0032D9AB41
MAYRSWLSLIWLAGAGICCALLLVFAARDIILFADIPPFLERLMSIYLPIVAMIVGFWFAEKNAATEAPPTASRIAIGTSLAFNALMIVVLASTFWAESDPTALDVRMSVMSSYATYMALLVGPAIGWFFGKQ